MSQQYDTDLLLFKCNMSPSDNQNKRSTKCFQTNECSGVESAVFYHRAVVQ